MMDEDMLMSPEKITPEMKARINAVKKRILFLSPSVTSGEEREARKEDFESLANANIGVGGFGRVYKVRHKKSKNIYAIKVINKTKIIDNDLIEQIKLEVRIMYALDHPHIIKLYNHYEDDDNFYLILQYASKGQLYTKLKTSGRLDERMTAQYLREVISAVEYLHDLTPPIIHRDIKPENILLDSNESAKLADFGWSNFFNADRKRVTYCGTPEYLAPEMIKQSGHDESLDLWNIGVLMFELLTGRPPFEGQTQNELFGNIQRVRINFPKDFSQNARDLVRKLLKANPKERISLQDMKKHPWFDAKFNPPIRPVLSKNFPIKKKNTIPKKMNEKFNDHEYEVVSKKSLTNKKETEKVQKEFDNTSKTTAHTSFEDGEFKELESISPSKRPKDKKDLKIFELSQKIDGLTTELNESKRALQVKTTELVKITDEYKEMSDLLKKGSGNKAYSSDSQEIKALREEVQKLRQIDKDRDFLLNESEEKNNVIRDLETKLKLSQNEVQIANNSKDLMSSKYSELREKHAILEKKFSEVKVLLETTKTEKDEKEAEMQSKIDMLQTKIMNSLDKEGGEQQNDQNVFQQLMTLLKDMLEEIRDKIKQQIQNNQVEESLRNQLLETDSILNKLRTKYENEIFEINSKNSRDLDDLLHKHEIEKKELLAKKDAKIEELRKTIELLKKAASEKEVILDKNISMEKQNQGLQKLLDDSKLEISIMKQEQGNFRSKLKDKENKIMELEYQLAVHKDLAFKKELDESEDIEGLTACSLPQINQVK